MKEQFIKLSLISLLLLSSCVKLDSLIYINEKNNSEYNAYSVENYKIRPFDNLSIQLNDFGQTINQDFNNDSNGALRADNALFYLNGYLVDKEGYIDLPRVGKLNVLGLTISEIKKLVDSSLKEFINFPSVSVKLINFRVSVLGEVNNPGVYYVYENKITLIQALSLAGDLTDFANRKKITLIRESDNGSKTVKLNLSKSDFLSSEYFFLMPNDTIYVEPDKSKAFNINSRAVGVALSALSIVIGAINLVVTISK